MGQPDDDRRSRGESARFPSMLPWIVYGGPLVSSPGNGFDQIPRYWFAGILDPGQHGFNF